MCGNFSTRDWFKVVREAQLEVHANSTSMANANMLAFRLFPEEAAHVSLFELNRFICACAMAYLGKISNFGESIYYAWHDDQAGQLRMSGVLGRDLPFKAQVRRIDDPSEVSFSFMVSSLGETLGLMEFTRFGMLEDRDVDFILPVYVVHSVSLRPNPSGEAAA